MFINTKNYLVARKLAATNIWWEKEQPDHLLCWTSEEDKKLKVLSRITIQWRHPVKSACKENDTYLGPLSDFGDWVTIWSIELMLLASIQKVLFPWMQGWSWMRWQRWSCAQHPKQRTRSCHEDPRRQARSLRHQVKEACTRRHKKENPTVHWSFENFPDKALKEDPTP